MPRIHLLPRPHFLPKLATIVLAAGCSGEVGNEPAATGPTGTLPGNGTVPGVDSTVPGGGGPTLGPDGMPTNPAVPNGPGATPGGPPAVGAGGGGSDPGSGPAAATCAGTELAASKRIVRLSFNQIANSIGTLLDESLTERLATDNAILDSKHRAFPPLQSPREGGVITDGQWTTIDAMASAGGKYVLDNVEAVTGCSSPATEECAKQYLASLAERAYRRPLTTEESARVTTLYDSLAGEVGASVEQAVQHTVYALLQSPQFVYRTELGDDFSVDGPLTQYELASALSYFLMDDMPDQELLDAAAQGQLATGDQVAAHVDRILQSPEAKRNLEDAMMSYFNYQGLENVVIQDPGFTDGVAASMYHEGELFLQNTLWSGALNDLLLSRQSIVNESLAEIYGITAFPPPGVTPDSDGFAPVELPADRSGIVTMPGFLSTRSRPTETSVVGRGLLIKNAFLCTDTPPPSADLADEISRVSATQMEETEREKSMYRQTTPPCSTCHATFDPFGVALENYDLIGRFRTMDDEGRPIDSSVELPLQIGGGQAANMVEVARSIADTGAFAKCMGRNLINYALADTSAGSAEINSCSTQSVATAYAGVADQTFAGLVRSVASSTTFANRSKGADQ